MIDCIYEDNDKPVCIGAEIGEYNHICKWCREYITNKDIDRMIRFGQPHCDYQQKQEERLFLIIVSRSEKE